jgi:quercetin dioxygenase-like cupin family protein
MKTLWFDKSHKQSGPPQAISTTHPQEQWGLCVRGSGLRRQGGEEIHVSAGDFWRTPGGVEHGFTAGPDGAVIYDVFAPPREEYKKAGAGFS